VTTSQVDEIGCFAVDPIPDSPFRLRCRAADGTDVLTSPEAVLVVVAGAANAGVSAVVETFGPRGGPPPVVRAGGSPGRAACFPDR